MQCTLILTVDEKGGLSRDGIVPWKIPSELLKETNYGVVILGRKTFENSTAAGLSKPGGSLIDFSEVDNRKLMVLGSDSLFKSTEIVKERLTPDPSKPHEIREKVYLVGSPSTANTFIRNGDITRIILTVMKGDFNCTAWLSGEMQSIFRLLPQDPEDTTNPVETVDRDSTEEVKAVTNEFEGKWGAVVKNRTADFTTYICLPRNQTESQIQRLILGILDTHSTEDPNSLTEFNQDRTQIGTLSQFGAQMTFDLTRNTYPLMTLRKSFFKGIFQELMWFLRGQTNSKILEEQKITIWQKNSSRAYLDSIGLSHLEEGDCGPIYGHQWRHWGAEYINCQTDYSNQGKDQIAWLISEIKKNPTSRRLILSGWNVSDLDEMALPPCHTLYQFSVRKSSSSSGRGMLSCHLYQRSSDLLLAGHWNISSASLLTILLASVCGLVPEKLVVSYGDVHIYRNHLHEVQTHLTRVPLTYPKLFINVKRDKLEDYQFSDLSLEEYYAHPSIPLEMNA